MTSSWPGCFCICGFLGGLGGAGIIRSGGCGVIIIIILAVGRIISVVRVGRVVEFVGLVFPVWGRVFLFVLSEAGFFIDLEVRRSKFLGFGYFSRVFLRNRTEVLVYRLFKREISLENLIKHELFAVVRCPVLI